MRKRYQVTIPKNIREALNLEAGDYFEIETHEQGILLKPMKAMFMEKEPLPPKWGREGEIPVSRVLAYGEATHLDVREGQALNQKRSLRGLVDQFILDTQKELEPLNLTDAWNDQMTIGQYLALSEAQRDQLWEEAFAQAHSEMEHAEEIDADADYVPAGQRDC